VVDGFFPVVERDAEPAVRRAGLVEFGLPFAADAVITRHIAAFLKRQRPTVAEALGMSHAQADAEPLRLQPDAVLLNGGVYSSYELQKRILDVLGNFRGGPLKQLDNPEPELAVSRGAVAYSLARRGIGLKIGGGSARSYYMLVKAQDGTEQAVCVLPRGAEEGEAFPLPNRNFALRTGQPVRFRLLSNNSEQGHRPGLLITLDEGYQALPDIAAVIEPTGCEAYLPEVVCAARAGIPVIATARGAGFVTPTREIPPGDPDQLGRALDAVLADPRPATLAPLPPLSRALGAALAS